MRKRFPNLYRRRAVVTITLLIMGLLAIAGLAIDGVGVMRLRRQTQRAADAGLRAALYVKCLDPFNEPWIQSNARQSIIMNGFDDADPGITIQVFSGPTDGINAGDPDYVQVNVSKEKPKYLIQLVYYGPLVVTSRAIGSCVPATSPSVIYATGSCPPKRDAVSISGSDIVVAGDPAIYAPYGSVKTGNILHMGDVAYGDSFITNPDSVFTLGHGPVHVPRNRPGLTRRWDISNWAPGSTNADDARADGRYLAVVGNTIVSNGSDASDNAFGTICTNGRCDVKLTNNGKVDIDTHTTSQLEGLIYVQGRDVVISADAIGPAGITVVSDHPIAISADTEGTPYDGDLLFFTSYVDHSCRASTAGVQISGNDSHLEGLVLAPDSTIYFSSNESYFRGAMVGFSIDVSSSKAIILNTPMSIPRPAPSGAP